jgi:hypothetical protein
LNTFKDAMDGWQSVPNEYGKLWRVRTLDDGTTQINPDDLAQYYKDKAWTQSVSDNLVSKVTMVIGVRGATTTTIELGPTTVREIAQLAAIQTERIAAQEAAKAARSTGWVDGAGNIKWPTNDGFVGTPENTSL